MNQQHDERRFHDLTYEEWCALTPQERRHHVVEFEQKRLAAQRRATRDRQAEIDKANTDRAAKRVAEEEAADAEERERSRAHARRTFFDASPAGTKRELGASSSPGA